MKRSDEAHVVEKAHRRPRFVEDCVREMVRGVIERFPTLDDRTFVSARQVNLETIHQHNVVAERFGTLGEIRSRARRRRPRRRPTPRSARGWPARPRSERAAPLLCQLRCPCTAMPGSAVRVTDHVPCRAGWPALRSRRIGTSQPSSSAARTISRQGPVAPTRAIVPNSRRRRSPATRQRAERARHHQLGQPPGPLRSRSRAASHGVGVQAHRVRARPASPSAPARSASASAGVARRAASRVAPAPPRTRRRPRR